MTPRSNLSSKHRAGHRPRRPRPRSVALGLERLEDRLTPTGAGSLDTTFGASGIVSTGFASGDDKASGVAVDSSGRIVVAGTSFNGSNNDFAVARYTATGSLDFSFNGTGRVTTPFGSSDDVATCVAIDSSGRIVVAGYTNTGGSSGIDFAIARYNTNGSLDTTFGTAGTGKVITPIGSGSATDEITAITFDSSGRIVVAGFSASGSNSLGFAVARYNPNGTLDTTFNSTGKVMTSFGSTQDLARGIAIDGSGDIVVVGNTSNGTNTDFAIARYTPLGALDTTFNGTGKVTTDFNGFNDSAAGVAIDSSGRIDVAGTVTNNTKNEFGLARYNANGTLDTTFGMAGTGKVVTDIGATSNDVPAALLLDSTGRIVVVGSTVSTTNGSSQFALARYTSGGVLDSSFGTNGETTLAIGSTTSGANAVVQDSSGRLVVAGYMSNGSNADFAVARFIGSLPPVITSNGGGATASVSVPENSTAVTTVTGSDPNPSATLTYSIVGGSDGSQFTMTPAGVLTFTSAPNFEAPTDSNGDNVYNVTVQVSDGTLTATQAIAVSVTNVNEPPSFASGTALDPSFGVNGVVTTALAGGAIVAAQSSQNIAVDSSGRFVVVGKTSGNNFAIVRYTAAGALDTTFGTNGSVTLAIGSDSLTGQCVAIDSNGRIVVGGFLNGGSTAFAMARYTSAGALDTTFGAGGVEINGIGINSQIEALAFDGFGRILAVGTATVGGRADIILARYSANGLLDTSSGFGTSGSGTIASAFGTSCNADSVVVDSAGKIVIGGQQVNGQQVMLAARFTSAGALDTTFGSSGTVSAAIGSGTANANLVAIDSSGRILLAGGGGSNLAMARYSSAGVLDTTFGSSGIVSTPVGAGSSAIESLTFDSSGRIDVAGFSSLGMTAARYSASGALDSTFGTGGIVTATLAAASSADKVTIDSNGRILAAGISGGNFELARYVPNVSTVSVVEGTTTVTPAAATDPDAGTVLTYTITGGSDAAKFSIDATTGILHFLAVPDFENPADSNGDNVYNVTEQVSDGSLTATQAVAITVTNVAASSATVYVNAAWQNLASGTVIADADPTVSGNQPATVGVNAFGNIPGGADALAASGTLVLLPGTYSLGATFSSTYSLSVPTGSATITASLGGSAGLTKVGTGSLTLTATNGYTGPTTVSAGTLVVNGSIASSSGVTVGAAGTLGGSGTLGNSVSSSGVIAPGSATPGSLSATFLTLGSGTLSLDLASSASYDHITGSFINITGTTLALNIGTVNDFDTFTILAVAGRVGGLTGTFVNLPANNSTLTIGSRTFQINYAGGDGNDVTLTALPSSTLSVVSTVLNGGIPYVNSTLAPNQHSMVENVVFSFSQAVTLSAANFAITGFQGTPNSLMPTLNVASSNANTVWTVTFSGNGVNSGTHSIGDGEYQLVLSGVPGGLTSTFDFYRLMGDMNGDGLVNISDFSTLVGSFLRVTTDPAYLGADDLDGDGTVGIADVSALVGNFLHTVPTPLPN
jgi:uncharacterized delta-60 repeat protein